MNPNLNVCGCMCEDVNMNMSICMHVCIYNVSEGVSVCIYACE